MCSHLGQWHRLHTSWYKKNIHYMNAYICSSRKKNKSLLAREMEPNGKVLFKKQRRKAQGGHYS
jgi:hypothetical protein